jgi:hypothetical protein
VGVGEEVVDEEGEEKVEGEDKGKDSEEAAADVVMEGED